MKKNYQFFLISFLLVFYLSACGSDSKNEPSNDPSQVSIVGTWRCINNDQDEDLDDYYVQYVFKKNGTGLAQEWASINGVTTCIDEWPMSYNYDSKKMTLTMIIGEHTYKYDVELLSATQLVLIDGNDTEIYTRVN